MKVFISVDMEGVSGVTCWDHVEHGKAPYERFRRVMTAEVNAAIDGALAGGATAILVNDSHGWMRNVLIEELHPQAELISGSPKPLGMMCGVDAGFDVAFLLGYHAKAGTPRAILDHTWSSSRVYSLSLNGQELGELAISAALAGHFGVPIALVTGDQATAAEAKTLLGPNLNTVVVKRALSRQSARCLPPERACELIRAAAKTAMADPHPNLLVIESPVTVEIAFMNSLQAAGSAAVLLGAELVDGRRVRWTASDMPGAFDAMLAMLALS